MSTNVTAAWCLQAGAACLPENVNRDCRKVEGTCVLQIVAAADVARPSRAAALGASSKARHALPLADASNVISTC